MNWNLNSALIIGRDHELAKKNRQDALSFFKEKDKIIGVVCDGCGESQFSEIGSSLLSIFTLNLLKQIEYEITESSLSFQEHIKILIKRQLETEITRFIQKTMQSLLIETTIEEIDFIKDYFLSTILFFIINEHLSVVGHCGDGVIIVNKDIYTINQTGSPHYISYKCIPKEVLDKRSSELDFFNIEMYPTDSVSQIVIGSDGLEPIINANLMDHLLGTQKRQLQRRFNLWQEQKMFSDDASCIVAENLNQIVEHGKEYQASENFAKLVRSIKL